MKKMTVRGRLFEVLVDDAGNFYSLIDSARVSDETWRGLEEKLNKATRIAAARVSVPFVRWDADKGLRHGTLTGIHAANGNLLVKWEGVKGVEQEYPPSYPTDKYLEMNDSEQAEYVRLCKASQDASEAVDAYAENYRIDPKARVQKAIDAL